jgi:hypothetical protein
MSSGTPTSNLGLHTFDTLDDIDYAEINANFTDLDQKLPMLTCTSTTRPTTTLYDGRLVYETDTDRVMRYSAGSSSWKRVTAGKYEDYAANWSGASSLFVGAATIVSKRRMVNDHCDFTYSMTRAADTNLGNADYTWDLPATGVFQEFLGMGYVLKGSTYTPCYIIQISSTAMALARVSDGTRVGNAAGNPWAWATGDKIVFRGSMRLNAVVS